MSATATTSTWKSPSHSHSHSRSSRPSTTPRGYNPAVSVGQSMPPPLLSPKARSPHASKNSPSPSYFGFVVGGDDSMPPDSNPGHHARQNWDFPSSQARSTAEKAQQKSVEANPEYAEFRRQSEQHARFTLNTGLSNASRPSQSRQSSKAKLPNRSNADTPISPGIKGGYFESPMKGDDSKTPTSARENKSFFDIPRQDSPGPMSQHQQNVADHTHARLSLPNNQIQTPPLNLHRQVQRAETLPPNPDQGTPTMISPAQLSELLDSMRDKVLLLDLRVYPQYSAARVHGALNLCIPTTLLKRPSFTVQKLLDTFSDEDDREKFETWEDCPYIVLYDASSLQLKEATTSINVLKKFVTEGWKGKGLIVKGGFSCIAKTMPSLLDDGVVGSAKKTLAIATAQDAIPVAGGCSMPSAKSAANPFFGNIRQNMDLLDGVGQMPVKKPSNMSESSKNALPTWLKRAASISNEGKLVSDLFLQIEKSEQKRMQEALSGHVSYGTPTCEKPNRIQIAGIEKGSKNRYNNIFPYDHTRVRLQDVPEGECDYINANHVRTSYSNRHYIATQAPIPSTMDDFWRLTWEQNVRVIVMLTAEKEGGQVKSNPYWNPGSYGPLKLKLLSEKRVSLEPMTTSAKVPAARRPSMGQRRSTNPNTATERKVASEVKSPESEEPSVIVRHLTLSHSAFPFQPMREITQLQYTQWPDFGAPAVPTAILSLVDQMNKYVRVYSSAQVGPNDAALQGQRPIIVHCSAGCGRTGTFCTIDSVIDMLKLQSVERNRESEGGMQVDSKDDWINRDDIDLVAKVVEEFRNQRLSMVQNLRQFVLCYESVMQWWDGQNREQHRNRNLHGVSGGSSSERPRLGKEDSRRSYHG